MTMYSGNLTKWIKFANSETSRLASVLFMLLMKQSSDNERRMAVKRDNGGVIEITQTMHSGTYFEPSTNPLYTATRYNAADTETGGDTCCC